MTSEEIHQLAVEIYEALKWEGAELGKYSRMIIENVLEEYLAEPKCHFCSNRAYVEGWYRPGDGIIQKIPVCQEHAPLLIGYKKEG